MSSRRSVVLLALCTLLLACLSLPATWARVPGRHHHHQHREHHQRAKLSGLIGVGHAHRRPTPHRNLSPGQLQQAEAEVVENAVEADPTVESAAVQEESQASEDLGKPGVNAAGGVVLDGEDVEAVANCHYYSVHQTDQSDYFANTNDDRCPVLELLKCKACTAHPKCVWDQSTLQCGLASAPRKHEFFSTDCSYINTDKHSFVRSQELARVASTIKRDHLDTIFFMSVVLRLNKAQIEDLMRGYDIRLPELKREEVLKKYTDRADRRLRDELALQFDNLNPSDALVSRLQLLTHVLRVVDQYKTLNAEEVEQPTLHVSREQLAQEEAENEVNEVARKEIEHIQVDQVKKHFVEPHQRRPNVPANPHKGAQSVVDAERTVLDD